MVERILVTGSAGFIGQRLLQALREQELEVLEIDQVYGYEQNLALQRSEELINEMARKADQVYHLAGHADPDSHLEPLVMRDDILAARRVMEACKDADTPLVVVSSAYALTQNTHYGVTKSVIESLANTYWDRRAPVSVARLWNVYGPGQELAVTYKRAVVLNLFRAFRQGKFEVKSNASRDFIYIDDVVTGLQSVMRQNMQDRPGPCELGSGQMTSIYQLGRLIAQAMGKEDEFLAAGRPPVGVTELPPYERPADHLLAMGFSLEVGIKRTVEHLLEHT